MKRVLTAVVCGPLAFSLEILAYQSAGPPSGPADVTVTLQQAVRMALDRAPAVRLAQARALRAGEAVRETRSLNRPQVVVGTGLAYNNGFPLSMEGAAPSIFQVGVSQSILSKKNKELIRESEEDNRASELGAAAAQDDLAASVALAYYELHRAQLMESLWTARLQSSLKEAQARADRAEAGRARPLDVRMAETATAGVRQRLLVAHEQAALAQLRLKELTGVPADSNLVTEEPELAGEALGLPAERLYAMALETNAEIRQAEALVQAREHHVESEKGNRYPQLDVVGQYALFSRFNNYEDYFNRFTRNNYLLGLSVQVPVFDGHRNSARVAQSRQEAEEARCRLQELKSQLRMRIERSMSEMRIAQGAKTLAQQEFETAQANLQVQESMFEQGRVGPEDLDAAQDNLREKDMGRIEADGTLFQSRIELLRLGGSLASYFSPN